MSQHLGCTLTCLAAMQGVRECAKLWISQLLDWSMALADTLQLRVRIAQHILDRVVEQSQDPITVTAKATMIAYSIMSCPGL